MIRASSFFGNSSDFFDLLSEHITILTDFFYNKIVTVNENLYAFILNLLF